MTTLNKEKLVNLLFFYNFYKNKNSIFIRRIFLQPIECCILKIEILNSRLNEEIKFIFHYIFYLLINKNRFPIISIN